MTRRNFVTTVLGVLAVAAPSAVEGGIPKNGVVRVQKGDIVLTLKRVSEQWKASLFPGNLKTTGEDAPEALRAMADLIEQTFKS